MLHYGLFKWKGNGYYCLQMFWLPFQLTFELPDQICNSPYCQPHNFYNVSSENLVLDQLIIPKLIFVLILITYLIDIILIMSRKILSWSLMGVRGLTFMTKFHLT